MDVITDYPITLIILGYIANILSVILYLCPISIMVDMIKTKNTDKIAWMVFLSTILTCQFWVIYSLKIKDKPIFISNVSGFIINQVYLILFTIYLENTNFLLKSLYIILQLFSFQSVTLVFHFYVTNKELCGIIACIMRVYLFASPIQKIREVYKHKDNTYIPIHIAVTLFLICVNWTIYAILLRKLDWFIFIPNGLGVLLSTFSIYVWFIFKEETEHREHENFTRKIQEQRNDTKNLSIVEASTTDEETTFVNKSNNIKKLY